MAAIVAVVIAARQSKEVTIASGVMATASRLADTAERDYFTSERG